MTRPLRTDERQLLDGLATSGHTLGTIAARHLKQARDIRNTAARARRALGARSLDHAIQIHRTNQEQQ
ncbi:hypothetical protein [Kitasatospora griseola]|uniref:hypothetical protein n=1 Tax=Kitasatospora griseola TaxID=2064 RepID=UPI00364D4E6B